MFILRLFYWSKCYWELCQFTVCEMKTSILKECNAIHKILIQPNPSLAEEPDFQDFHSRSKGRGLHSPYLPVQTGKPMKQRGSNVKPTFFLCLEEWFYPFEVAVRSKFWRTTDGNQDFQPITTLSKHSKPISHTVVLCTQSLYWASFS